jgi:hypothetical protein
MEGRMTDETVTTEAPPETEPETVATRTIDDDVRRARSEIAATPGVGVDPAKWQQMVVVAQDLAKGHFSLPPHLRGQVGDCLAIVNVSMRTGMDPWLVAGKTYVQKDRLCMESQLHHALLVGSRYLRGALNCEYLGEGEERVCIVVGYLKGDPQERVLRSPPLKQVRPQRNEQGVVKGSPLWDRDPDQQLWYYASRAWQRRFCPQAALGGIWAEDEVADMPEVFPPATRLQEGLASNRIRTDFGFRREFADRGGGAFGPTPRDLGEPTATPVAVDEIEKEAAVGEAEAAAPARRPYRRRKVGAIRVKDRKATQRHPEPARKGSRFGRRNPSPPTKAQVKAAADRAEQRAAGGYSDAARTYVAETLGWIAEVKTPGYAEERWAREYPTRARLNVPQQVLTDLRRKLDARIAHLKENPDDEK